MRLLGAIPLVLGIAVATVALPEGIQLEEEGLTISGTVMRPGTREPVPGVRVGLGAVGRITTTDAGGQFRFTGCLRISTSCTRYYREIPGKTSGR